MADFQPVETANVMLWHELLGVERSTLSRYVAKVNTAQSSTSNIQLVCPVPHDCHKFNCGFKISGVTSFAIVDSVLQPGDLVEVVGFVNDVDSSATQLQCEFYILRNINGIDLDKHIQSVHILRSCAL